MSNANFSEIAEKPPEERKFEERLLSVMREKFFKGDIEDVKTMDEQADKHGVDVSIEQAISEKEVKARVIAHIFGGTHNKAERIATLAREAGLTNKTAVDIFREHEQIEYDDHISMQDMKSMQGYGSTSRTKAKR